jgi:ribonuclease P protein component
MSGPERVDGDDRRWGFARLTQRAQFQRVSKGSRSGAKFLSLQTAVRSDDSSEPRIGLTITRKVGGAVERNRIRRRLRAALKLAPETDRRSENDYVVVARREALTASFPALCADLAKAFERIHKSGEGEGRRPGKRHRPQAAAGGAGQR